MTVDTEILELLACWDRLQVGYIEQREERFGVMFDILAETFGDGFTVIDAARGPGCGHEAILYGDHTDYLVNDRLHHVHDGHCDDHGPVEVVAA